MRGLAAAAALAMAAGCGSEVASEERCDALQAEYVAAVAEARHCDPQAANPCGGTVPANLDAQCPAAVRPEQVGTLNALITRYQREGCKLGELAPCLPQTRASCEQDAAGEFTCVLRSP
ncbi:hypothetical protein FGE12_26465 [Aggregicoccus sp. 17bor-14]|uniref:hypothetical protein n=1 Tax=Myxococcaceae TaxID=31 RepID=UPI00129C3117|nr:MULTISPECIES: hypothetical protein [Myxococcaceae]MBF5045984.1 hypothetical protein [Simulacricoccus sp. 17bor-14]MRI91715.1 hypothetical protein [Aggregicoccus sp. 17bor-14]